MKHKFIISIIVISLIVLSACQNPIVVQRRPCSQPNTKWISDDGKIVFTVDDNMQASGKIFLDDKNTIEFYLTNDTGSGMYLFDTNVIETKVEKTEDEYEYWLCSYISKEEFVAVVKRTTFFNVGEKIVFHRI